MARNSQESASFIIAGCFAMIILYAVLVVIGGVVVMIAWNLSIPSIFGLSHINFFQALGLSLLAGALSAPRMAATRGDK